LEHTGRDGDSTGTTSQRSTRGAANSTSNDSPTLFPLETSPRSTEKKLFATPAAWDAVGSHGGGMGRSLRTDVHRSSCPEDFLVRTCPLPVRVPGSLENVPDSGLSTLALLARYDLATQSWRTSERSLGGDSIEFSGRWPKSGILRNGLTYELPTLERRTDGNASGLWPIPRSSDADHGGPNQRDSRGNPALPMAVKMWPTPTTPRPHDNEKTVGKYIPSQNQKDLTEAVARDGGQLNPEWVEVLMGFPLGFTDMSEGE
jgi:hypothetical protein